MIPLHCIGRFSILHIQSRIESTRKWADGTEGGTSYFHLIIEKVQKSGTTEVHSTNSTIYVAIKKVESDNFDTKCL